MRKWITTSRIEGKASRQAHCDLPENTYERELGKEGFFGPAFTYVSPASTYRLGSVLTVR